MQVRDVVVAWGRILTGRVPFLSIEITRECPLKCPGCYAYGDSHLAGEAQLKDLSDFKGDELVRRVLALVDRHKPLHVSLVGGEPMMRKRELDRILPELSRRRIFALLVSSGVIPIPAAWSALPRVTIAISIDGLPEHHNVRRAPATYERILKNTADIVHNVHLTITRPMVQDDAYLDGYMSFWNARANVRNIWASIYTPQRGEQSPEMLTAEERARLSEKLLRLGAAYPKMLMKPGVARAYAEPPVNPSECTFAKMSVNYTADLKTRVEPCIFGGDPDCSQCGCAISAGLHWMGNTSAGPIRMRDVVRSSVAIGSVLGRFRPGFRELRWNERKPVQAIGDASLVQIAKAAAAGDDRESRVS